MTYKQINQRNHRAGQSGQAIIFGLVLLVGGIAAMFFMFNAGQLVNEKTKLVNTADAVGMSGAILNSWVLSYDANNSRESIVKEALAVQLVSMGIDSIHAKHKVHHMG